MLRSKRAARRLRFGLMTPVAVGWVLASGLGAEEAVESTEDTTVAVDATFVETVTVSATRSELAIKDTPGQVDVIGADEIEELGYTNVADLVRFTPGVYVDGDLTRLGTSGFNIRGIGGNRVLTQIDGIPTAEQFDFGPFSVTQYSLDLDNLERAEIVRSAGSALYGSDALGGVVSLVTRGPGSYLGDDPWHLGLRLGYDDRADELSESVVYAQGGDRWQGSVVYTHRDGSELENQGAVATEDFTRTALSNPIDRWSNNVLAKLVRDSDSGSQIELAFEWYGSETETEALSGRAPASPFSAAVRDQDFVDTQDRLRLSLELSLVLGSGVADSLIWRAYWQQAETDQVEDSTREDFVGVSERDGLVAFEQETFGFEVEARKALDSEGTKSLTYGGLLRQDTFDGLRDRLDFYVATGAPVPTTLALPTKYFPESDVEEIGLFVQGRAHLR